MNFSEALNDVKKGYAIQRSGWSGDDLWVSLQSPDENSKMALPYLYIEYPDGRRCPWSASQTDLLADDWSVMGPR